MNKINYLSIIIVATFVAGAFLSFAGTANATDNCQDNNLSKTIADDGTMSTSLWSGQQLNPAHPATIYGFQPSGGNPGSFYQIKHAKVITSDGPSHNTGTVNLYNGNPLRPATDRDVRNLTSINMSVQTYFQHSDGDQLGVGLYMAQQGGTKNIVSEKVVYGKDAWITSNFTITRSQLEQMNFNLSASGQPIYIGFSTSHSAVHADNIIKVDNFRATLNYSGFSCQNITCNFNSDCGTNGYTGSPFCQGNSVYKNYTTYTCNNSGTTGSYCSNSTNAQLQTTCGSNQTCQNGSCTSQNITCNSSSDCGTSGYTGSPFCQGNSVYKNYTTYTCNNSGTTGSYCSNSTNAQLQTTCGSNQTCQNGSCSGQNCTNHSYQRCSGNNLYWYDSCGNQQDLYQYCQNGCYNNSCYGYNYPNCTYHAYKLCVGNNIYWYDSCGNQQDLFQACYGTNQICQYGQCVYQQYIPPAPSPYIAHYNTACYGNNLYWYDSLGQRTDLYKSCSDSNSCTHDTCAVGKCSNALKCDGSTCAVGSADYNTYCATSNCGNGVCEQNLGETSENCLSDCKVEASGLSVSLFVKQDPDPPQWQKSVQIGQNSQVYFMLSVANSGSAQIDNVNVSANIPGEVAFLGNVQVNGVLVTGDIVSGINIGSLAPATAKSIIFEGKTQTFSSQITKQAIATVNVSGTTQTDSVDITFSPGQVAGAAISPAGAGFWDFLKRWYLWILVAFVLIFLFFVIFRRLSSNA